MATYTELTDGQRNHLRGLPVYPWAVWICRLFLGAFALVFTLSVMGRSESLAAAVFLLLMPLALMNSVANRLVFNQMKLVLHVQRFRDQARLVSAINQVLYRDSTWRTCPERSWRLSCTPGSEVISAKIVC